MKKSHFHQDNKYVKQFLSSVFLAHAVANMPFFFFKINMYFFF